MKIRVMVTRSIVFISLIFFASINFEQTVSASTPSMTFGTGVTISGDSPFDGGGASYYFDGTANAYISIPSNADLAMELGDFTIEWFSNQDSLTSPQFQRIFSIGDWPNINWGVSIEGGTFYYWANGGFKYSRSSASEATTWIHWAIVRESNITKVYKNGTLLGSQFTDNNDLTFTGANGTCAGLCIGNTTTPSDIAAIKGYLTNLRIVKGVAVYTGNFTTPTSSLGTTQGANPFGGSNTEAISGDQTVLLLMPDSNTITYNLNGGSNAASNPSSYSSSQSNITLDSGIRNGYDFLGWFENADLVTSGIFTINTSRAENITLYAKWSSPINYSITYNLNDGVNHGSNPSTFNVESSTLNLLDPTRTGYSFEGWFENADLETSGISQITTGSTGNKEVYAKWSVTSYSVTYQLNEGTNDGANPSTYTIESSPITFSNPTRSGYTFEGWFENSDLLTSGITQIDTGTIGNKTVYAKWSSPNDFNVTYDLNGGINNESNPATYNISSSTITLASPSRSGYTFDGWFEDSDLVTSGISQIDPNRAEALTFYAKWTGLPTYSITYNLNGGVNSANISTYTTDTSLFTLLEPTRTGFTFDGWFEHSDLVTSGITQIDPSRAVALTLYAKWIEVVVSVTPPAPAAPPVVEKDTTVYTFSPIRRRRILEETVQLLIASGVQTIEQGEAFEIPTAVVQRTYGFVTEELDVEIGMTHDVDVNHIGTYSIVYTAVVGDEELKEVRTIHVIDSVPPELTVTTKQEWYMGETIQHQATAIDQGKPIDVEMETNLNSNQPGTYEVTYKAVDAAGNETTQTISLVIKPKTLMLTALRFNKHHQYLIMLSSNQMNLNHVFIDVVQTTQLIGFIEWQPYEEGMEFLDYSIPVYIRVKDDLGREFIRKVELTIAV